MTVTRILAGSVAALLIGTGVSQAASCTGVELRVNRATTALEANILALIQSHKTTMITTELAQRQQILSALAVATKQAATTGNQDATVRLKAEEAHASAVVAGHNRMAVLDAQERYGDAGFNACEIVERSRTVAEAWANEDAEMDAIKDEIINKPYTREDGSATKGWFDLIGDGQGTSASVIFSDSSTDAEVAKYIDWLMGPPQTSQGSAAGAVSDVARLQGDALRSVTQYLLMKAAVSRKEGSVDQAISDLSATWTGTGGGADWAAKLATSPLRAVLLDMSRAEAANLVAEIRALEQQLDLELGLAALSLARSTKMVEAMTATKEVQ